MASILFAMAVVAFLVVVYWAFRNDKPGRKSGMISLLEMRDAADPDVAAPRPRPRWAQGSPQESPPETPVNRPQPRWRRAAQLGRWRS